MTVIQNRSQYSQNVQNNFFIKHFVDYSQKNIYKPKKKEIKQDRVFWKPFLAVFFSIHKILNIAKIWRIYYWLSYGNYHRTLPGVSNVNVDLTVEVCIWLICCFLPQLEINTANALLKGHNSPISSRNVHLHPYYLS